MLPGSRIEGTGSAGLQTGELLVFVPVWRPALPGGLADGVEGGAGAHGGCSFGCIWLVVAGDVDGGALDGDEFGDDGFLVGGEVVGEGGELGGESDVVGLLGEGLGPVEG